MPAVFIGLQVYASIMSLRSFIVELFLHMKLLVHMQLPYIATSLLNFISLSSTVLFMLLRPVLVLWI